MNWAGISEDEFNEKLEAAGDESERNRLIMETLSKTYDSAADSFYKNNQTIIKNRQNQQKLNETLSKVGDAFDRVKNMVIDYFSPAIVSAGENVTIFLEKFNVEEAVNYIKNLFDVLVSLSPAIAGVTAAVVAFKTAMTIASLIDGVTTAIQKFKNAQEAATLAQAAWNAVSNANTYVLIATLIIGVVTALVTLWNTNEGFREAVIKIWDGIKNTFQSAWEFIVSIWDAAAGYFSEIWAAIQFVFDVAIQIIVGYFKSAWAAIEFVWNAAIGYFANVWNSIKLIFSAVESVLRGNFEDAWNAIKEVLSGWGDYFSGLFDKVKEIFSHTWEVFEQIGRDTVDALKEGIKKAWDEFTSWFNGLWDSLFGNRSVEVDIGTGGGDVDGSHARGLDYVPFDGYIAELHKGESILTANEASQWRSGKSGITVVQNIYSQAMTAADLMREAQRSQERAALLGV